MPRRGPETTSPTSRRLRRAAVAAAVAGTALAMVPFGGAHATATRATAALPTSGAAATPATASETGAPAAAAPAQTLRRYRCARWTFVPLATTTCTAGTLDRLTVRREGTRVLVRSAAKGRWVAIPYSWNPAAGRLELDARKIVVPQPPAGTTAPVWRWTCRAWTLTSDTGPTTCTDGSAERVRARFSASGGVARIYDVARTRFVTSRYRWVAAGGYLALDATLVPAASVDLGPSMTPRPDPSISDYVVDCPTGTVTASVTARAGGSVVVDGGTPTTARTTVPVPLSPGQSVSWVLSLPGSAPVTQQARCLPADFPRWTSTRTGAPSAQWYLFTPDFRLGPDPVPTRYVVVADAHGTPVWWRGSTTTTPMDAKLLADGRLTWTTPYGPYFSYSTSYVTSGWDGTAGPGIGDGLDLDDHDLVELGGGDYLGVRYVARDCLGAAHDCVDMTAFGGSTEATFIDAVIQRFHVDDAGTSTKVGAPWLARDHIDLQEWSALGSPAAPPLMRIDIDGHDYWDWNHINAVEPDGDGLLVSFRHLSAVYRIRTSDGSVDWKLGGTPMPRSLTVLGLETYPVVASQHDARRLPNGDISVYDNGTAEARPPRVIELSVDPARRTARIVRAFGDDRVEESPCCGSARRLSTGHWVVAWGGTSWITETDADGSPVLTMHLPEELFTYRAIGLEPGVVSRATLLAGMDAMHPRPAP